MAAATCSNVMLTALHNGPVAEGRVCLFPLTVRSLQQQALIDLTFSLKSVVLNIGASDQHQAHLARLHQVIDVRDQDDGQEIIPKLISPFAKKSRQDFSGSFGNSVSFRA